MFSSHSDSDFDDDLQFLLAMKLLEGKKKKRRYWAHPINKGRQDKGEFHRLVKELESDEEKFHQYFRMNKAQYEEVHSLIEGDIKKVHTKFREPIGTKERLALCLRCCTCTTGSSGSGGVGKSALPLICLVPRDGSQMPTQSGSRPAPVSNTSTHGSSNFTLLDDEYIKKNFKLPQRSLYLDPFRRPLITFPMDQEDSRHFNLARKTKINQQILDGYLDASEAISAPSVFPYAKSETEKQKDKAQDEEIIYILQLPDWEFKCPVHNETIRTPRFIWHSCKKAKEEKSRQPKQGGGPLNKPKPWLLSRHTDFDLLSQW